MLKNIKDEIFLKTYAFDFSFEVFFIKNSKNLGTKELNGVRRYLNSQRSILELIRVRMS